MFGLLVIRVMRALVVLGVAFSIEVVGVCISVATLRVGGVCSTDETIAQMVRRQCPLRLVQPEWLGADVDILDWMAAEFKARMIAVLICAVVGGILCRAMVKKARPDLLDLT